MIFAGSRVPQKHVWNSSSTSAVCVWIQRKTDNAACRITASVFPAKKEYLPDETVCRSERFSP